MGGILKKKREEYFFKVFNVSKIKYDKDYFILLTIFLISLYGIPIKTMGYLYKPWDFIILILMI